MLKKTVEMPTKGQFDQWGQVLGHVDIPEEFEARFKKIAADYYDDAEAKDFSGDDVEPLALPEWLTRSSECSWFPDVCPLGFERYGNEELLITTLGVDPHPDFHGAVLMLTLHNDGLGFRQGKARHKPTAGDWFIFNDRANHSMTSAKGKSAFIGWHVPLTWVGRP